MTFHPESFIVEVVFVTETWPGSISTPRSLYTTGFTFLFQSILIDVPQKAVLRFRI